MKNGLTETLCAGRSYSSPSSRPIVNVPPGTYAIPAGGLFEMPDSVVVVVDAWVAGFVPVCTFPAHGRQTNNATVTASTSAPPTINEASLDVLLWLTDSLASEFAVSAPLCPH